MDAFMGGYKAIIISIFIFLALSVAFAGFELMSALKAARSFRRGDDESVYHDKGDER